MAIFVLPQEAAQKELVAYVRADLRDTFPQTYKQRLERLASACANGCPAELTRTIRLLASLKLPQLEPLGTLDRGSGTNTTKKLPLPSFRFVPSVLPLTTPLPGGPLNSVFKAPSANIAFLASGQGAGICSQLIGTFTDGTDQLATGQAISILNLLFWGEMGIDPTDGTHPAQGQVLPIPYQGKAPIDVLNDVLGAVKGNGKGVTIHVLDTASNAEDPFKTATTDYYNTRFTGRPGHGAAVGEVARQVAPNAKVDYRLVCDTDGNCSTYSIVKELCAVAGEARRGGQHVVNLSLGGPYPSLGVLLALNELATLRVPTVASYGNREDCKGLAVGDRCNHYPADWSRDFALDTTPGSPTMLVSVAGWDIASKEYATYNRTAVVPWALSTLPTTQVPGEFWLNDYPYVGTSFAAPVVSGLLANWMSCQSGMPFLRLETTPGLSSVPSQVLNACP